MCNGYLGPTSEANSREVPRFARERHHNKSRHVASVLESPGEGRKCNTSVVQDSLECAATHQSQGHDGAVQLDVACMTHNIGYYCSTRGDPIQHTCRSESPHVVTRVTTRGDPSQHTCDPSQHTFLLHLKDGTGSE
jgi:hypothetical protein